MVDAVLMRKGNIGLGVEKVMASRTFWTHIDMNMCVKMEKGNIKEELN